MVGDRHRLLLVVGDVQRGDARILLQAPDLGAQLDAELGVEVAQRLVEQEHLRRADQRPGDRDPLLLAAGELTRFAVEQRGDADAVGGLARARVRPRPCATPLLRNGNAMLPATDSCGYSA